MTACTYPDCICPDGRSSGDCQRGLPDYAQTDRDIAVMRASIIAYKEARNGIERHPGNTAHENAAWEWGRKDGGWDGKH